MGGIVSFCPPCDADQHCPRSQRHCPPNRADTHNQSLTTAHNPNADTTTALASRNLLVVVDDEDSPIKNRAEYAMSPTVAERVEQEVEDELRRRRQEGVRDEMKTKEADINTSEQKKIDTANANHKQGEVREDLEQRDEVQDAVR